jgi:D-glycero-D-manno-heptose 1,7-bisphosphate phosphatase
VVDGKRIPKMASEQKKAIFLDRDNTLIEDRGYFHDPDAIAFLPNVAAGLHKLQQARFLLFIISNQSGIGRGYFPESDAVAVHKKITELLKEQDVHIEKIYYCPHAPEENCSCRKPRPDLVLRAAEEFGIELANSFFIGDHMKDMETGLAAGTTTVFLGSPQEITSPMIDLAAIDLVEAAEKINLYEKLHGTI